MMEPRQFSDDFCCRETGKMSQKELFDLHDPAMAMLHTCPNGRISFRFRTEKLEGAHGPRQLMAVEQHIAAGADTKRDGFFLSIVVGNRFHLHIVAKNHALVTPLLP